MKPTRDPALQRAFDAIGRGAAQRIADECGVSYMAVYTWKACPADRVLLVCRLAKGAVTPHDLAPTVFPVSHEEVEQAYLNGISRGERDGEDADRRKRPGR